MASENTCERLLSIEEVADRLGVQPRFVRRLVQQRRLRHYKVGRFVRFHPDDVDRFVEDGRVDPAWPASRAS
jgi:excisionase family DNA binding protein